MLSDAVLKSELKYFSRGLLLCTFVSQDPKALMGPLQGGKKKVVAAYSKTYLI